MTDIKPITKEVREAVIDSVARMNGILADTLGRNLLAYEAALSAVEKERDELRDVCGELFLDLVGHEYCPVCGRYNDDNKGGHTRNCSLRRARAALKGRE